MKEIRKIVCATISAAAFSGIVLSAEAELHAVKVSEVSRPEKNPEQLSGITYAGGNLYYAVDDEENKLYPIRMSIDRDKGTITHQEIDLGITLTNSIPGSTAFSDVEGCAFDPASGNLWVSQESGALIREVDPKTGRLLRSASVPSIMTNYYGNYSLEALTISGDGKTMWTCNEEALRCDGQKASFTTGTVVRLTRFIRASVYDNWTPSGQWAYETEAIACVASKAKN